MHTLSRYRALGTWLTGAAAAVTIAVFGASTVLAEDPACTKDGRNISAEEAAANPSLCAPAPPPAAAAPAPAPAPSTPAPDPAPAPEQPAPAAPAPSDPAPDAPAPADPAPSTSVGGATDVEVSDPAALAPAPQPPTPQGEAPLATAPDANDPAVDSTPASEQPDASTEGASPDAAEPRTDDPRATSPTRDPRSGVADPVRRIEPPMRATPVRETRPALRPTTPAQQHAQRVIRAKLFPGRFVDARMFREQFVPDGRVPDQPKIPHDHAALLTRAAAGTGTSWALLAAISWDESRWGADATARPLGSQLAPKLAQRFASSGDEKAPADLTDPVQQARALARYLADAAPDDPEAALRAYYTGADRTVRAHRTKLMADYLAALGKDALVNGLDDAKVRRRLERATLNDERITIYSLGREDIEAGIIDPRILITVRFLAERFDTVSISSMVSGHGVYTTSGNVSLHAYGQAVDVASLGGEIINASAQHKGGKVWEAVRDVLLLPEAMQPKELISLWTMGGPSFALADHADHIHVGFAAEPDRRG